MQAPARFSATGQRDIQRFFGQARVERRLADHLAALVERGLDGRLGDVDRRTGCLLLLGRQLAEAFQQFGNLTALAKETGLHLLQCIGVGNGGEGRLRFANDLIEIVHGLHYLQTRRFSEGSSRREAARRRN
jgi:hypothetical protein